MERILALSSDAHEYLMAIPIERWIKFDSRANSPHVTNNACKDFNNRINKLRDKVNTNLARWHEIKNNRKFLQKISNGNHLGKQDGSLNYQRINLNFNGLLSLHVNATSKDKFEVIYGFTRFVVNLAIGSYECSHWAISSLPCKHVATCIRKNHLKIEDYCDKYC